MTYAEWLRSPEGLVAMAHENTKKPIRDAEVSDLWVPVNDDAAPGYGAWDMVWVGLGALAVWAVGATALVLVTGG